jgi:hypothetical protein
MAAISIDCVKLTATAPAMRGVNSSPRCRRPPGSRSVCAAAAY